MLPLWALIAGPAAAQQPAQGPRAEALREVAAIVASDPSFDATERAAADALLEDVRGRMDAMSDAAFELALAEIIARADNGHTQVLPASWQTRFQRLGVRFFLAGDGLHVMDAAPEWEALVGARVDAIEGRDLAALRETWSRYAPGVRGFRDESLPAFLESPALLHAAGIAAQPDAVVLTIDGGRRVEVGTFEGWPSPEGIWAMLPAARQLEAAAAGRVASADMGGVPGGAGSAGERPAGADPAGVGTAATADLPLYLEEPEAYFRFVPLPEYDAVYLQFRANVDFSGRSDMAAEASRAIERLRDLAPRYVIVDQRFNIGGDLNTTRALMQTIPEIVPEEGGIFAITSGRTFSAGIASLGYLVQAAGGRVTIVGEPVGDALEFWAEGGPAVLPTGTAVLAATERHNYVTGCAEDDCHGSIRRHPIRVRSLEPDIRPTVTWADFVAGRDPYLDAVLDRIRGNGVASGEAVEALLRLHHEQRVAHVLGDADLLVETLARGFVEVRGGEVASPTRAALLERFGRYFRGSQFLEWDNVRPPRIRLSPDGAFAEIIVQKRVRALALDGSTENARIYAWTEGWRRGSHDRAGVPVGTGDSEGAWQLATITSTATSEERGPPATLAERREAARILAAARLALGGDEAVARVATLSYEADSEGPGGSYTTTVRSARDGRKVLIQEVSDGAGFAAGVSLAGAWTGAAGEADTLDSVTESVIEGHEYHLLALAPEARFEAPRALAPTTFEGRSANVVEFRDRLGAPVPFFFDVDSGVPLGFELVNHTGRGDPQVRTTFGDWRPVGDVRLPFLITIRHGPDAYTFRVTQASERWLDDDAFGPRDPAR